MDNLDPTAIHSLTVFNFPDPRFQGTGQLTFDHLIVSVSDNAMGQTMMHNPSLFNITLNEIHADFV